MFVIQQIPGNCPIFDLNNFSLTTDRMDVIFVTIMNATDCVLQTLHTLVLEKVSINTPKRERQMCIQIYPTWFSCRNTRGIDIFLSPSSEVSSVVLVRLCTMFYVSTLAHKSLDFQSSRNNCDSVGGSSNRSETRKKEKNVFQHNRNTLLLWIRKKLFTTDAQNVETWSFKTNNKLTLM